MYEEVASCDRPYDRRRLGNGCGRRADTPVECEPGWNTHKAADIGIDDFQANRSPDRSYRTAPLRGLMAHAKGGFYHDGRFADLAAVVEHYNQFFKLELSDSETRDLIEYLESL